MTLSWISRSYSRLGTLRDPCHLQKPSKLPFSLLWQNSWPNSSLREEAGLLLPHLWRRSPSYKEDSRSEEISGHTVSAATRHDGSRPVFNQLFLLRLGLQLTEWCRPHLVGESMHPYQPNLETPSWMCPKFSSYVTLHPVLLTMLMVSKTSCLAPYLHTGYPNHCFLEEYLLTLRHQALLGPASSRKSCLAPSACSGHCVWPPCCPIALGPCCSITSFYVLLLCPLVAPADFVPKGRNGFYCLWHFLVLSTAGGT